jgi:ElaB/YqjD/DUF883 family membrane-anchored ribosome-binding protein
MSFFNDAWKAMDGFGQEAGKNIGGAADDAGKAMGGAAEEAGKAAGEAAKHADDCGKEAGKNIAGAAQEAAKHADEFGQEAGKNIAGVAEEAGKQFKEFGEEADAKIRPALEEAWNAMDAFGQEAGRQIDIAVKRTKRWVGEYPSETAGIVACIVAAASAGLHMVGFTATGVAAGMFPSFHLVYDVLTRLSGSAAAAAQSGIGSVAAGSTFAILQSAGAGGAGAVLVNGIAAGTATGIAVAATAPGLVKAIKEGKKEVTIDDVTYKIDEEQARALLKHTRLVTYRSRKKRKKMAW